MIRGGESKRKWRWREVRGRVKTAGGTGEVAGKCRGGGGRGRGEWGGREGEEGEERDEGGEGGGAGREWGVVAEASKDCVTMRGRGGGGGDGGGGGGGGAGGIEGGQ